MAEYRVLFWRDIPSMVVARGGGREVQGRMPPRYQDAIDEAAMASDATGTDAYLEAWIWGPATHRDGSPEDVLREVLADLERSYSVAPPGDAFTER